MRRVDWSTYSKILRVMAIHLTEKLMAIEGEVGNCPGQAKSVL
ncbi:MAG TPA: hypothetical protein VFA65_11805 [Bryobacteraceae bacterium]|nr:hypothetical protein [Bryobacteraceae bacterium]